MAKTMFKVSLPFDLCRAAGSDKDAHDFMYDYGLLLGFGISKEGDDLVLYGFDSAEQPPLTELESAIAKGGYFEGVRVAGMLKTNELDDAVPAAFPNRMNVDVDGNPTTAKTYQEWLDSNGAVYAVSNVDSGLIFKWVFQNKYLTSVQLADIIGTSKVIDFDTYSTLLGTPEYTE